MVESGDIAVAEVVAVVISVDGKGVSPRSVGQKGSGSVAVVKIEIENCACANGPCGTEVFKCDDQAVESAEAFSVLGGGVMESAGDGGGDPVGESGAGGREDGPVSEKDRRIELRAPRKLLRFGECTGISSFDGVNIILGMDTEEVVASDRGGWKKADA